jgi:hypothetical protein
MILFRVITFKPIKIQTFSEPQNDHLNLSFVKNYAVGEKWLEIVVKLPFVSLLFCASEFIRNIL